MLYLMEPITLGTSYYTCAFCKRPTLATLVFKLWGRGGGGELYGKFKSSSGLAGMFEDEVRTPLPLPLDNPLEK